MRDELVAIVDPGNNVVGAAPRWQVREQGLLHRATYIYVFNARGELYVQLRTMTKDVYPGYLDLAAGGVVLAEESYEVSAARELEEEMGIAGVELEPWFDFYFAEGRVWGRAWSCEWNGELCLQEEEVESVVLLRPEDVLQGMSAAKPFTPDSLMALRLRLGATAPQSPAP